MLKVAGSFPLTMGCLRIQRGLKAYNVKMCKETSSAFGNAKPECGGTSGGWAGIGLATASSMPLKCTAAVLQGLLCRVTLSTCQLSSTLYGLLPRCAWGGEGFFRGPFAPNIPARRPGGCVEYPGVAIWFCIRRVCGLRCQPGVCIADSVCSPSLACMQMRCLQRQLPMRCRGRASALLQVHFAFSSAAHQMPGARFCFAAGTFRILLSCTCSSLGVQGAWFPAFQLGRLVSQLAVQLGRDTPSEVQTYNACSASGVACTVMQIMLGGAH